MKAASNRNKLWSILLITIGLLFAFFSFNGLDMFKSPVDITNNDIVEKTTPNTPSSSPTMDDSIPSYVRSTYAFITKHGDAPHGYYGGRAFQNREKRLPQKTKTGTIIQYREWDVHPKRDGVDRGAERLVTGSDKSAWYTADHYGSFIKIE